MDSPHSLLAAYLDRNELSYAGFARQVGADRARIQRIAKGERGPGLELALAIEAATLGAVPVSSWAKQAAAGSKSKRGGKRRRHGRSIADRSPHS